MHGHFKRSKIARQFSFDLNFAMSKGNVLYSILKRIFALLLANEDLGDNCEFLVQKLDARIQQIRRHSISNELLTSLSNLKGAVVCLRASLKLFTSNTAKAPQQAKETDEFTKPTNQTTCTERTNKREDGKHLLLSCPKDAELQKELEVIQDSDKFKQAVKYFRQSSTFSEKAFKKDEGKIKITATKVRVISEILGNLTNFSATVTNCSTYISELHHETTSNLHESFLTKFKNSLENFLFNFLENDGVMHINVVVFRFMKEFLGKPLAMLDWPMINGHGPEKHHPILGELPSIFDPPDPFTYITGIDRKNVQIESSISAINCTGDIFAKDKASANIIKVTPKCSKWYSFEEKRHRKIISVSINCSDCKASTKSKCGETSTRSSETSPGLSHPACRGKMYILARSKLKGIFRYYLYVIDLNGRKLLEEELEFLERMATEVSEVRIFCIKDKKLVIIEHIGRAIYVRIWSEEDKVIETIDMTKQLGNTQIATISHNGEITCLPHNEKSRLNIYNLNEGGRSLEQAPSKTSTIDLKRTVKTVTYSDELMIIICYAYSYRTRLYQYHLVTYTKDGQLMQDIKLDNANGKYGRAKLISHGNGPVLLFDNDKLLYLKR